MRFILSKSTKRELKWKGVYKSGFKYSDSAHLAEEIQEEIEAFADRHGVYPDFDNDGSIIMWSPNGHVILYHGTTEDRAKAIMEEGFKTQGKHGKMIWFTQKPGQARKIARHRAEQRGEKAVVFCCEIALSKYSHFHRPNSDHYAFRHFHIDKDVIHSVTNAKDGPPNLIRRFIRETSFITSKLRERNEKAMIDVVPLRYDTAFKKAFGKTEVFCQFVKDVLGIEIHVDRVIAGWRYPEPVGFVDIEYDPSLRSRMTFLFAEDTEKRVIVELQHIREEYLFDRFLYYHLIAQQVKTYTDYRFDKTVYTLVVVTGKSHKQQEIPKFSHAVSNMDPVNEFGTRLGVYPHRLIFLNPNQVNEKTPESIKSWLELIADSLDERVDETRYSHPTLQTVISEIKSDNITPQELK